MKLDFLLVAENSGAEQGQTWNCHGITSDAFGLRPSSKWEEAWFI
jgi:hypothetical protein